MLKETFFLYMKKAILSLSGSGSSLLASIPVKNLVQLSLAFSAVR